MMSRIKHLLRKIRFKLTAVTGNWKARLWPQSRQTIYKQRRAGIGSKRRLPLGKGGGRGNVIIGRWSYYGNSSFRGHHSADFLAIGAFCSIAENVKFLLCPGHHFPRRIANFPVDVFFHTTTPDVHKCYTRIGNDVWIGDGAIILPGIIIGNGAIIAAGSVVTRDVRAFEIVGGNPAQHIDWRIEPELLRQTIQAIGWWEWTDDEMLERSDFFLLPAQEAAECAHQNGWIRADGVSPSYLQEVVDFFSLDLSVQDLDKQVREFFFSSDVALPLHLHRSLSYENIAVWMALLKARKPSCILEFGTQTGCSAMTVARLCRHIGIKPRIVTINIKDELIYREPDVEYVVSDYTGNMHEIWSRWNPDIIFQDAHMYHLIHQQLIEGEKHPRTVHLFHDVGFRLFRRHMSIPLDAVPTSATGSWERHVLSCYAPPLLDVAQRHFENNNVRIHIFDASADSGEYGLGVLEFMHANE